MSYDKSFISDVLAVFIRTVQGWYKTKAKEQGYVNVQGGSVSFVQRFGSSLGVTPHVRSLALDGVYVFQGDTEQPFFCEVPSLTDEDIKTAHELLEKLAAIVPPPRSYTTR